MDFCPDPGRGLGPEIEWRLQRGRKGWVMIDSRGGILGTRDGQMMTLIKGHFSEIGQLEKNLDNEINKRLAEHEHYVSRITAGNKELAESSVEVKKQLN